MHGEAKWPITVIRTAWLAGLAAGAVYAVEIMLEYAFLPRDNTPYGYVEFGTVFLIYALAAAMLARARQPVRNAVRASFLAAIKASTSDPRTEGPF